MANFSFYLATDIHYYSKEYFRKKVFIPDQLRAWDSREMFISATDGLKAGDVLILTGDLTKNGEVKSHEEFLLLLHGLKERGITVYAFTASHDYFNGAKSYRYEEDGSKIHDVDKVERRALWDMYYEFGPCDAVSFDEESMSYAVRPVAGLTLFFLNGDDFGSYTVCGLCPSARSWLKKQGEECKKRGDIPLFFAHYPLFPSSPIYDKITTKNMLDPYNELYTELASYGGRVIFTGHSHVHNVSSQPLEKGEFYDVSTAALSGFPPFYRKVEVFGDRIDVTTLTVPEWKGYDQAVSLYEYTRQGFFGFIEDTVKGAAAGDKALVKEGLNAISITGDKVDKFWLPIRYFGKKLNGLDFYKLWKKCKKKSGIDKKEALLLKDQKVFPFLLKLAESVYAGNPSFEGDVRANIITGYVKKIDFWLKIIKKGPFAPVVEEMFFGNGLDDSNISLPLI